MPQLLKWLGSCVHVRERLAATRTFVETTLVRLGNVPEADHEGFLASMRNEMPCLHGSVLAPFGTVDWPLTILLGSGEHRDEHANEGVGGATAQLVGCVRTGVEAMGARLVLVDMSPFYTADARRVASRPRSGASCARSWVRCWRGTRRSEGAWCSCATC